MNFTQKQFATFFKQTRPRLLYLEREPLVDHDNKLILFWSQKSGCTSTIRWFFRGMGKLQEAEKFSKWIHEYRLWKYHDDAYFQSFPSAFLSSEYRKLRITRNPFNRVVSGYIHLVNNFEHYRINPNQDFTFSNYVDWLEKQDLDLANGHFARQNTLFSQHFLESVDEFIPLENLASRLNEVNLKYQLNNPYDDSFSNNRHHYKAENQITEDSDVSNWNYTDVLEKKPHRSRFLKSESMVGRIIDLYKPDFEPLGYKEDISLM